MVIKPQAFICMLTDTISVVSVSFLSVASLQGDYTSGTWEERTQEINFADFKFCVSHNYLKQEASESESKEELEEGNIATHLSIFSRAVTSIMVSDCGSVPARVMAVIASDLCCLSVMPNYA